MASWQQYVDTNLVATGNVTRRVIAGTDAKVWAVSAGWKVLLIS